MKLSQILFIFTIFACLFDITKAHSGFVSETKESKQTCQDRCYRLVQHCYLSHDNPNQVGKGTVRLFGKGSVPLALQMDPCYDMKKLCEAKCKDQ